jgi:hypothetical protein
MMETNSFNAFVRETSNGTLFLLAVLVVAVFGQYIWRNRKTVWKNRSVLAAAGILGLMFGVAIRAGGWWLDLLLLPADAYNTEMDFVIWMTLGAVVLTVGGESIILYVFAPLSCRWYIISLGVPLCVLIPLIVAVATRLL